MTDRYDLLIESMRQAARAVNIFAVFAVAILAARWSIKYIPRPFASAVQNLFDLWLVAVVFVLFVISK